MSINDMIYRFYEMANNKKKRTDLIQKLSGSLILNEYKSIQFMLVGFNSSSVMANRKWWPKCHRHTCGGFKEIMSDLFHFAWIFFHLQEIKLI